MTRKVEHSNKAIKTKFYWSLWFQWVAATVGSLALVAELARRFFPIIFGFNMGMVIVTGIVVMGLVGVAQGLILRRFFVPMRGWVLATLAGSAIVIAFAAFVTFPIKVPGEPYVAVQEYDSEGNFLRSWTGEEVAPGHFGSLLAILDGAADGATPSGGSVAVGTLGSGIHVGDFDTILGLLVAWLVGGASVGIAQWLVLRRRIIRVAGWIWAAILGKVAAGICSCIVLENMTGLVTSLEVPLSVSLAGMVVYSAVQGAATGVVLVRSVRRTLSLKEGTI
jgi:hypothetical protein